MRCCLNELGRGDPDGGGARGGGGGPGRPGLGGGGGGRIPLAIIAVGEKGDS